MKEGDRNTSSFHKIANAHRRRNSLARIKINGTWLSKKNDIKEGVVRAFQNLLTDTRDWRPSLVGFCLRV